MKLVIALYEGAIDATQQAKTALASGDVFLRSRSISKAVAILAELMSSLDHAKGAEISANLKRLYSYMQQRLLVAHAQKSAKPMDEVISLLKSLLESWQQLAANRVESAPEPSAASTASVAYIAEPAEPEMGFSYGGYFMEMSEAGRSAAFSF